MLVLEDITQRKKTDLELLKVNRQLEQRIEEIQSLQEKLQFQAVRDALTGTFNRGFMDDTLVREIAQSKRKNLPLSVFMIDIDNFKIVNDAHGHHAGDAIIKKIGQLLRKQVRESDCVCRYGGDEFVIIFPEMNEACALIRAEDLRQLFKTTDFTFNDQIFTSTISIGVAVYPQAGENAEALMIAADNALYEAKASGRDCVKIYSV